MKKIVFFILILLTGLFFTRDFFIKAAVESGAQFATGLRLQISSIKTDIRANSIDIRGLRLLNPAGFEEPVMLDMPEIFVQSDIAALFLKGRLHIPEIRVHLKEFNVVKDSMGRLNLDALKSLQKIQKPKEAEAKKPAEKARPFPLIVDALALKAETVSFKDFTKSPPSSQNFKIGLDERYEKINNLNLALGLIVSKALMKTTIGKLTGFDVSGLNDSVSGAWNASKERLGRMAAQTQQAIAEKTPEAVKEKAGATKGWLAGKTQGLKEKLSGSSSS